MFEKDTASVPRSILSPPGPNNANVSNTTFQILNHFSLCPIEIFCSKQKMNNPLYVSRLKSNIAYNSKKKQQKVSHQIVNIHSYYKLRKGSFYLLYSLLIVSSPTQLLIQSRNRFVSCIRHTRLIWYPVIFTFFHISRGILRSFVWIMKW